MISVISFICAAILFNLSVYFLISDMKIRNLSNPSYILRVFCRKEEDKKTLSSYHSLVFTKGLYEEHRRLTCEIIKLKIKNLKMRENCNIIIKQITNTFYQRR